MGRGEHLEAVTGPDARAVARRSGPFAVTSLKAPRRRAGKVPTWLRTSPASPRCPTRPSVSCAAPRIAVRAGGSIFPTQDDSDATEHIGNILTFLSRDTEFDHLLDGLGLAFEMRERLWSAAVTNASNHADAGFLFGAFVGLEMAALNGAPIVVPKRRTATKARTR